MLVVGGEYSPPDLNPLRERAKLRKATECEEIRRSGTSCDPHRISLLKYLILFRIRLSGVGMRVGSDFTFLPFHIQLLDNLFTGNREQFESLIHYLLGNDV